MPAQRPGCSSQVPEGARPSLRSAGRPAAARSRRAMPRPRVAQRFEFFASGSTPAGRRAEVRTRCITGRSAGSFGPQSPNGFPAQRRLLRMTAAGWVTRFRPRLSKGKHEWIYQLERRGFDLGTRCLLPRFAQSGIEPHSARIGPPAGFERSTYALQRHLPASCFGGVIVIRSWLSGATSNW